MTSVAKALARVQAELKDARQSVRLVGVTKGQTEEKIREAAEAGLSEFGNNYAQEGEALREKIQSGNWHFIGHIQSRKVKYLLDYDLIQSLDRLDIAADLNRRLEGKGRNLDVLIEVNIGNEVTKAGIPEAEVLAFRDALQQHGHLRARGLMCMVPALDAQARRPYFRRMKSLFDGLKNAPHWDTLSMGTSDDYLVAVEEGATMIRLGTVLFGPRP